MTLAFAVKGTVPGGVLFTVMPLSGFLARLLVTDATDGTGVDTPVTGFATITFDFVVRGTVGRSGLVRGWAGWAGFGAVIATGTVELVTLPIAGLLVGALEVFIGLVML